MTHVKSYNKQNDAAHSGSEASTGDSPRHGWGFCDADANYRIRVSD